MQLNMHGLQLRRRREQLALLILITVNLQSINYAVEVSPLPPHNKMLIFSQTPSTNFLISIEHTPIGMGHHLYSTLCILC